MAVGVFKSGAVTSIFLFLQLVFIFEGCLYNCMGISQLELGIRLGLALGPLPENSKVRRHAAGLRTFVQHL